MRFNLIIPTHRKAFLIKLLENILNQTVKPDRIIIIVDVKFRERFSVNETIQYLLNELKLRGTKITTIHSHLTGALNAFKVCTKAMEMFSTKGMNNYYQIMEDDVRYLSKGSLRFIKNYLKEYNPEFTYVKLIDIMNNQFLSELTVVNDITEYQKDNSIIMDTCGMIFNFNDTNFHKIRTFNKIIKDLDYSLIVDSFAFYYFSKDLKFDIINKPCVVSTIHEEQISSRPDAQTNESSLQWRYIFKKYGINNTYIKYDVYAQYVIKILSILKVKNITLPATKQKPTFKFYRDLYRITISGNPTRLEDSIKILLDNLEMVSYIHERSLEIDKKWFEVNPYLNLRLKGK